jgi:predicted metalloprotease
VSFVLDDVQETWTREFQASGQSYPRAKLVLFTDAVRSGCGFAEGAMGPFYCPADQKVYIDLGFYKELRSRFGAPGDFAQAYVIAHEVGHHVQNVLGLEERMRAAQARDPGQVKALSVRFELQADCMAGVWAHSTRQRDILEAGDVEEALGAAAAVGDDRIQEQATGRVNPETWTHGSSQQRMQWFNAGLQKGRVQECQT